MERIEQWLDQGFGSCVLRHPAAADLVEDPMHHFDDERYALFAAIVMPNHAHVVLRPEDGHPLERILESWKKFSSRQIHEMLGGQGTLWQDESYDRIVRDTEELRRVIRYMKTNEQQIGGRRNIWITPSWEAWCNLGAP